MIRSLQLFFLLRKVAGASYNGIHTDSAVLARFKKKTIRLPNEPGISRRKKILQEDSDYADRIREELELDDNLGMMKTDQLYNKDARENGRPKGKIELKITANKFFKARPQPLILTYNERLCIQYLHKQDPVQWDFKTLSESFPATVDTIRKIVRSKRKITPERAKKMDSLAQKNWQLLSENKLDADPDVLDHLKKFVNRREVLLEQIKNENFYLPEIKDEPVWNQGEVNSILIHYEKTIKKLAEENSPKALSDTSSELKDENENKKSNLDLLKEKVRAEAVKIPKTKDSFRFSEVINTYRKHTTLEELENSILKKASRRKNLELSEKVILDNKMGVRKESGKNKIEPSTPPHTQEVSRSLKPQRKIHKRSDNLVNLDIYNMSTEKKETEELSLIPEYTPPDENTCSGSETDVSKILYKLKNKPQTEEKPVEVKQNNFSDPERLKRENIYFDKEVLALKDTAFWNNKKTSREKELAESMKADLDGPETDKTRKKIFVFSPDPYPERIRIPKDKQGSGMTFRVKDCYYDDDGKFLYRVPGMTK